MYPDVVLFALFGDGALAIYFSIDSAILIKPETAYLQMAREPVWQTYVFSALVTCLFSALTNGFALRRVKNLKLTDMS